MAEDTLAERGDTFNQSSLSSSQSHATFISSERIAKLECAVSLLVKAEALSAVTLTGALDNLLPFQRHHYHAALDELIVAAREQLDDVLSTMRSGKTEE